jgi:hypothetical protein
MPVLATLTPSCKLSNELERQYLFKLLNIADLMAVAKGPATKARCPNPLDTLSGLVRWAKSLTVFAWLLRPKIATAQSLVAHLEAQMTERRKRRRTCGVGRIAESNISWWRCSSGSDSGQVQFTGFQVVAVGCE